VSSKLNIPDPVPMAGAMLDQDARSAPPEGAIRLENLRATAGLIRSRYGYAPLLGAAFDSKRVIDIFDRAFDDGSSETIRCVRDATQKRSGGSWASITLDSAWTGSDSNRFWCVSIPFDSEAKGRIAVGNGVDTLKTWTGGAGTMTAYPGGFPSKYGIMGDDGRLFIANTIEAGNVFVQRARWTVIGLANGNSTDWTGTGSGALDLHNDQWPITGLWKQNGRLYVGKSRAICTLIPTGLATDAYGFETVQTNGEGLFAGGSLVQYGNLVAFVSHRGVFIFDGVSLTPILGNNRATWAKRFNYAAADQVTAVVDAFNDRVGWGFPLDGASTPTEVWWYHLSTDHWEMDIIPHTTLALSSSVSITTIDQLVGTDDAQTGTIDSLGGTGAVTPSVVMGTNTGATFIFDSAAKTDNGNQIVGTYVSPGFVPVGREVPMTRGTPHIIDEHDFLIIDEISVRFLDLGDTYMAAIDVSGDGGITWTALGTVTITTAGGSYTQPRFVRKFLTGRIPIKDTAQIRLTNASTGVLWGWTDATAFIDIAGEKKV
jgi:hypothetical protein